MLKIQKILNYVVWNTKFRDVVKQYRKIKTFPYQSKEEINARQLDKLNRTLQYSYDHVPYYRELFEKHHLVRDGRIRIDDFSQMQKIPFLTKDLIGSQQEKLHSDEIRQRGGYKNSSGGSTGVPTVFMQDRHYQVNNLANFAIAINWRGCGLYDSVVKIWGAERDTYEGKKPLKHRIVEFLMNYKILNSFTMTEEQMRDFLHVLDRERPCVIITYAQTIYELAKFAKEKNIKIHPQHAIHSTAGTLFDFMRKEVEEVFGCKVFNHYGSREIGSIASECSAHSGLHIMSEHVFVEVVNKEGTWCEPGEEGEILVTSLENFSMPLIRYKIGDIGVMAKEVECSCGCNYPKLEKVIGRSSDIIKTKSGSILVPEFFVYLVGVTCNKGHIKQFQVIQEELEKLVIKIVKSDELLESELLDIKSKIQHVMGENTEVIFEFVDEIPKTPTGKFLYTISKV